MRLAMRLVLCRSACNASGVCNGALTVILQCVQEDEVYDLQFGNAFAEQAVDPSNGRTILRDDFALEIADMDE